MREICNILGFRRGRLLLPPHWVKPRSKPRISHSFTPPYSATWSTKQLATTRNQRDFLAAATTNLLHETDSGLEVQELRREFLLTVLLSTVALLPGGIRSPTSRDRTQDGFRRCIRTFSRSRRPLGGHFAPPTPHSQLAQQGVRRERKEGKRIGTGRPVAGERAAAPRGLLVLCCRYSCCLWWWWCGCCCSRPPGYCRHEAEDGGEV